MVALPVPVQRLVRELSKLPSIGDRTATRLAYHLVNTNRGLAKSLAQALAEAAEQIQLCSQCYFLSEGPLCSICSDPHRDPTLICTVEKPMDLIAIERMGEFRGLFHVLHGLWAPLKGQGPDSMKLKELVARVQAGAVKEVILATSSTVEGDATALYVARIMTEHGVRTSRLAQGMPKGGELEYADDVTLARAFSGRISMPSS